MRKTKRKRRSPSCGTIDTLPSGKIRAVVTHQGRRIKGVPAIDPQDFDSREAAEIEAFRLLQERLDSLSDDPSLSFTTFARNWLNRTGMEQTTKETYQYWLKSIEKDPLGKIPMLDITPDDLDDWKRRQRLAAITVKKRLGWIHQLLKEAGSNVRTTYPKVQRSRRRPLSPREREVLREKFIQAPADLQLAILLAWEVGLRRSEICGLKHEDRDGEGIWINQVAVSVVGATVVKPRAKNTRSHGWIPLPHSLLDLIGNGKGFVLGGKEPWSPKSVTDKLQRFVAGTVLENVPRMGPHALRRTFGMSLLEMGVDVATAADLMRHDPRMLLEEYVRTREDLKVAAMAKTFGKPHGKPHEGVK